LDIAVAPSLDCRCGHLSALPLLDTLPRTFRVRPAPGSTLRAAEPEAPANAAFAAD
jgi:hypothetical protein